MDCSLPISSVRGDFPGKNTAVDFHALLQGIFPNPEIKPWSPELQLDSLPSGLPEKPTMEYYLGIKKEWNNAICSNIDGPGDDHIKWSNSNREKQISYDIAYMQN